LNAYGQLGDGTVNVTQVPVPVSGLTDVTAIGAGGFHSLAVRRNGTAWSWGDNNFAQLGDGTTASRSTPGTVLNVSEISAVAGGYNHSLFLQTPVQAGTVEGTITLQGIAANAPAQTLTFAFSPSIIRTAIVRGNGVYSVSGVPAGTYTVRIKGAKYLTEAAAVTVTANATTTLNLTLKTGDANDDNAVDITDLLALIAHYNQVSPASSYLEAADFNGDGSNDITDLLLLIGNYNQMGD
jgi:hypothetical protein